VIESAAILAAGQGTRLGSLSGGMPPGFLTLGQIPIVEESIRKLIDCGVAQIFIGTGFGAQHYEQLADRYPQVRCVRNTEYANSGSMYTLYQLRDLLTERFLLLESDIIYERAAIEAVVGADDDNVILASDFTASGDEVYIETDGASHLVAMSKDRRSLSRADAELVGISRISPVALSAMCGFAEPTFDQILQLDYEDALVVIAGDTQVRVLKVNGLAWAEIDDEAHLIRAREAVYPEILRRDALGGGPALDSRHP
jgi:2-aminoethylphosphonate-pyruvate transaminase/(2-aminoethyl)phosphonate cytidylyltransferase